MNGIEKVAGSTGRLEKVDSGPASFQWEMEGGLGPWTVGLCCTLQLHTAL